MQSGNTVPHAIGIIMDGNRRWAKEHGVATLEGHRAGLSKIKEVISWAQDAGIRELIFYTFSTENWNRAEEEVSNLMGLVEFAFSNWIDDVVEKGVRIRVIGERSRFSESVQQKIIAVEEKTKNATNGVVTFALSYGGRTEILSAVNELLLEGREQITEDELRAHMWSAGLADPDLIIRTGGEQRLSNFLTWQSVYSELAFTSTKWPAFSKEEFDLLLANYASRERRLGK